MSNFLVPNHVKESVGCGTNLWKIWQLILNKVGEYIRKQAKGNLETHANKKKHTHIYR